MRVGEVANAAGVNVQTVRFYERRGLLAKPSRLSSGYRDYPAGAAQRVIGVKRAQKLGFTLTEIQELMRLEEPGLHIEHVRAIATSKIRDVDEKIRGLRRIRKSLEELLSQAEKKTNHCPVLED